MRLITLSLAFLISFISLASADDARPGNDHPFSTVGNAKRGKIVFMRCRACHNATASRTTKTGPNLDNIFGRVSGQDDGYDAFSKALKDADITWGEVQLEAWLKDPKGFLPGNKMSFTGIRVQKDRNDLIAYLRSLEK